MKTVIEMAMQSSFWREHIDTWMCSTKDIERLVQLVRADERARMDTDKSKEAMKLALEAAYFAGWNASGEGYNAEYPFGDHARNPEEDANWVKNRDNALREALAEQSAQRTWVGLTDEDYRELHLEMGPTYFYQDYGRAIEAKLRSKNENSD